MNKRHLISAFVAVILSVAAHLAVLEVLHRDMQSRLSAQPSDADQYAAQEAAQRLSIGVSFSDLAVDMRRPVEPSHSVQKNLSAQVLSPVRPAPLNSAPLNPVPLNTVERVTPIQSPNAAPPEIAAVEPAFASEQARPTPAETTLQPLAPDDLAPALSERPKLRPKSLQNAPERASRPPARGVSAAAPPAGDRPNAGGSQRRSAPAQRRAPSGASDYKTRVLRHLARQPKPAGRAPGTAIVEFSIASNGAVRAARLAQSSGDARFDRRVLTWIRRVGPFPAPPPGAQRQHRLGFEGQ